MKHSLYSTAVGFRSNNQRQHLQSYSSVVDTCRSVDHDLGTIDVEGSHKSMVLWLTLYNRHGYGCRVESFR